MAIAVVLDDQDTTVLSQVFAYVVDNPAESSDEGGSQYESDSGTAYYNDALSAYTLTGSGFTYNASGILVGGTITGITAAYADEGGARFASFTGLAVTVAELDLLAPTMNPEASILAAGATITDNSSLVTTYGGDNIISIADTPITTDVDGNPDGINVAVFESAFRSNVTLDNVSTRSVDASVAPDVYANLASAQLSSVDKIQFIDGSVYESSALPDAQTALMFLGVFGRLPDALNAGGYAQLAYQSGQLAAATAMLNTPEGNADIAALSNTEYVTRLYNTILDRAPESAGLSGWVNDLNSGLLTRADILMRFATSPEAIAQDNSLFSTGQVFAATPNAVEILRAYTTLLGRLPEATALSGNLTAFQNGMTLQDFYADIQHSAEFASDLAANGGSVDGITASTPYSTVFTALHTSAVTAYAGSLINATLGVSHLAG